MDIIHHTPAAAEPAPRYGLVSYQAMDGTTAALDAAFVRGIVPETTPQKRTVIQGTDGSGRIVSLAYSPEAADALIARFNAAIMAHHARTGTPADPSAVAALQAQIRAALPEFPGLIADVATLKGDFAVLLGEVGPGPTAVAEPTTPTPTSTSSSTPATAPAATTPSATATPAATTPASTTTTAPSNPTLTSSTPAASPAATPTPTPTPSTPSTPSPTSPAPTVLPLPG